MGSYEYKSVVPICLPLECFIFGNTSLVLALTKTKEKEGKRKRMGWSELEKSFVIQQIPSSNLFMVVVDNKCDCSMFEPITMDPIEIMYILHWPKTLEEVALLWSPCQHQGPCGQQQGHASSPSLSPPHNQPDLLSPASSSADKACTVSLLGEEKEEANTQSDLSEEREDKKVRLKEAEAKRNRKKEQVRKDRQE
ncbi:Voltage-dependent calcium channel subunit alpha-2/delta-3 [Collichthys lucidus]|uniref:Voltage-dependent calcium channel subunit alpha-2/delta-3 n=1 Tax=Collichthys lucidus TaxID=240159 RepID=A0A4U5URG8_COLLU|nr:Voltage-dependent calcium channel subunit alpha-2/delta-3 [Collichthys lucidus]